MADEYQSHQLPSVTKYVMLAGHLRPEVLRIAICLCCWARSRGTQLVEPVRSRWFHDCPPWIKTIQPVATNDDERFQISCLFSAFRLRSSLSDSSPGGSLKLKQLSSKHFEPLKALGNIMFLPTFFGIGRAGFVSKGLLHSVGSI